MIKRLLLLISAIIILSPCLMAQNVSVTGTVIDTGSTPYSNGTMTITLVNNTGQQATFGGNPNFQKSYSVTLDSTGSFTILLPPNSTANPSIQPSGTQWNFSYQSVGNYGAANASVTVTAAGAVNISGLARISWPTSANPPPGGAGQAIVSLGGGLNAWGVAGSSTAGASIVTTGLIGYYQMNTTDTVATLKDYSGLNNNATGTVGTAPTIIAGTGGLQCPTAGAVLLPAAENAAQTIQMVVTTQITSTNNVWDAAIIGNGAPSATTGVGLGYGVTAASYLNNMGSFYGSFASQQFDIGLQYTYSTASDMTLVLDATTDKLYWNGLPSPATQIGALQGKQTTGVYQLCGAAAGTGNAAATYWGQPIYTVLIYNIELTPQQIYQNHIALQNAMLARGIIPSPFRTDTADVVAAFGDSTTAGNGFVPWTSRVSGLVIPASQIVNKGVGGATAANLLADEPIIQPVCSVAGGRTLFILLTGANDSVVQTKFGNGRGIIGQAQQWACSKPIILWSTEMKQGNGSGDAGINQFNTLIRQNCPLLGSTLNTPWCVDLGGTVALGANSASTNTTYFQGDQLHPTDAGAQVMTWVFQRAINRTFGNHDYSTANVYASAAPAAVAVTAGTWASNIMTFTTAANTFTTGQCITVAGTTSNGTNTAAYNSTFANSAGLGCWYVLTVPNNTTFTAWTGSSGAQAGSITVAGTAVAPQQVDADQVAILNFGAGNFTLEPCDGLSIYDTTTIHNINAVGSTIVPFGTETINGAANLAIAAGTTVKLQSQLISASAGGCNWISQQP